MSQTSDVTEFMIAAGQPVRTFPQKVTKEEAVLRVRLLMEEVLELAEAAGVEVRHPDHGALPIKMEELEFLSTGDQDLVEIADALTDIQYVNVGAAITWGIPLDYCFELVQESNMSKFIDGHRDEATGKWIKGPSYKPVDLSFITKPCFNLQIAEAIIEDGKKKLEEIRQANSEKERLDVQIELFPDGVIKRNYTLAEISGLDKAADDGVSYEK